MKTAPRERAIRTIRRAIETLADPSRTAQPYAAADVTEAALKLALPNVSVKIVLVRTGDASPLP